MKMADLTRESGVPTASIKFYLREGLLHQGRRTAPNQAVYDETHLRRLRLIRALRDVAGLGVETIRRLIQVVDDTERPMLEVMGEVAEALVEPDGAPATRSAEETATEAEVDRLFRMLGWDIDEGAAVRRQLADAVIAFRHTCIEGTPIELFLAYGKAVESLARMEIQVTLMEGGPPGIAPGRDASIERIVTGTVFGGQALTTLRKAAHQHFAKQFAAGLLGPIEGLEAMLASARTGRPV
jgi:DNA-binding transcriptional MerR regulator